MHYYKFNIGDYKSHTSGLSILEDIAYRRLLDMYYLNERPFNGCSTDVARDIGMRDYKDEVEYVLSKFFKQNNTGEWRSKRADAEIKKFHSRKKSAAAAGKASGKARRSKGFERSFDSVQLTNNQEPVTINQEPTTKNQEPAPEKQETPSSRNPSSATRKDKTTSLSSQSSAEDHELAKLIWSKVSTLVENQKEPNFKTWESDLRKMREIDGRTVDEIRDVFIWAHQDSFWQANIRSPAKLRKQFDQLNIKRRINGGSNVYQTNNNAAAEWLKRSTVIEGELA